MDEIIELNRQAWNKQARERRRWSTPVSPEDIATARGGNPRIILTPDTAVPAEWLGTLSGREILCLASAGGQQVPLLAAAGAKVTSFDLSDEQLALDELVAEREGLAITTIRGDMRNLSVFEDASFDLIVHVCSNVFCPDIHPVWNECFRVLRPGGDLLAGFMNPDFFLFDWDELERGEEPTIRYPLPYSDHERLSPERRQQLIEDGEALAFSHSLTEQIGGQLAAGFHLLGFYEDTWEGNELAKWFRTAMSTRARKPS